MQLDKTGIAIRERGLLEQMDLALKVTRRHIAPLTIAWLVGVVPLAVFNAWLLHGAMPVDLNDEPPMQYLYLLAVLMGWETPLATSFITLYLSRSLFLERPTPRELVRQFLSRLWQIFWLQIVLRGLLAFWVVRAYLVGADDFSQSLLGMFLVLTWSIPYVFYPLMNEILLLEGNPLRRRRGAASTISRTLNMHGYATGDLVGRWLMLTVIGGLLLASLLIAIVSLQSTITFDWDLSRSTFTVLAPLAGWMVIGYFAVVRFLGYLDLRIRIEGWEVELVMRAEGARIARQLA